MEGFVTAPWFPQSVPRRGGCMLPGRAFAQQGREAQCLGAGAEKLKGSHFKLLLGSSWPLLPSPPGWSAVGAAPRCSQFCLFLKTEYTKKNLVSVNTKLLLSSVLLSLNCLFLKCHTLFWLGRKWPSMVYEERSHTISDKEHPKGQIPDRRF